MIQNNITPIVIVLAAVLAVAVVLVLFLVWRIRRLEGDYELLTRDTEGRNFIEIVNENIGQTERLMQEVEMLSERYGFVLRRVAGTVQHVGVVRYDAFRDLGGLLSFSVAMLDDRGNGLMLSSIYGRSESRTYAKPVVERSSTYELSPEEREAIRLALQSKELGALPVEARDREHEEKIANLKLFHDKEYLEQARAEGEERAPRRQERPHPGEERIQRINRGVERLRPAPTAREERAQEAEVREEPQPKPRAQSRPTEKKPAMSTGSREARPRRARPPADKVPDRAAARRAERTRAATGEKEAGSTSSKAQARKAAGRAPAKRARSNDTPTERLRKREPGED